MDIIHFLSAFGLGMHVLRGYIYFGMSFALFVETLNILAGRKMRPKK